MPGARTAPDGPGPSWSGHAFGINLDADFAVAGLAECGALSAAGPPTSISLESEAVIAAEWDGRSPERLIEWSEGSHVQGGLDHAADAGYRLAVEGFGTFTLTPDGRRIRCAPPQGGSAAWQECLLGQVLPLAAVLRGAEVLHASAVSVGGRAAAFVGATTAGKTSLAMNFVARGACLLTDDVLSLRISDEGLRCYPGAGVVSLRHAEAASMGDRWRTLGSVTARNAESIRLKVDRDDRAQPLSALYFLDREARAETGIERLEGNDPRLLLASSFNFVIRDRTRLVNQLDVYAALSAEVPHFRVQIGTDTKAGALSEEIRAHLEQLEKEGV